MQQKYQNSNNSEHDKLLVQMGRRLAHVREKSGLKQIPFAETLQVSQGGYNTYERGQREIPVRVLRTLYTKFNVNPVWMMTGEGGMFNQDVVDLYHQISVQVDNFIGQGSLTVEPDKRLKLVRFLIGYAEQHGELTEETVSNYLRSAI